VAYLGQCKYELDGTKLQLQVVSQERDLGMDVSSDLKPSLMCS